MNRLISRITALPRHWLWPMAAAIVALFMGASWAAVGVLTSQSPQEPKAVSESPSIAGSTSSQGSADIAGGGGNINNEVVLINRQDGRKYPRAGFGTARVTGDSANNKNAAAAFSSCVNCRTVAVAVQIVLIMGDASNTSPQNLAFAMNQSCQGCTTAAFAYQYVITTKGIVHFTSTGETTMSSIRAQISDVAASDLDPFAMDVRLDELVAQMWNVVDSELVAAGISATKSPKKARDITVASDSPQSTPFPSSEPTPSAKPSPVLSTSPEPSPSPSPPSPSPSPDQSPTPSSSPTTS